MTTTTATSVDVDQLSAAEKAVRDAGKASTKVLQTALGIGYRRASEILDALEARGVVGPSDGRTAREVLPVQVGELGPETVAGLDPWAAQPDSCTEPPLPHAFALVDPGSLLVDVNIRETRLDDAFAESVRDLGVIVPIVAVRAEEGALRVRYGHRRTLAAVQAGHPTVPVVITDEATADEADRITRQWAENEHRAGLTTAEQVATIEQLSLLGIPADQIVKRTKASRDQIDAALTVAKTPTSRKVVEAHPFVTIDQAAALASIDDEDDVERLVNLLEGEYADDFAHEMQEIVDAQAMERAKQARRDELSARGITLCADRPSHQTRSAIVDIAYLADADGKPLDPDDHESCPGHAVYVTEKWDHTENCATTSDQVACSNWQVHGHTDRYARGGTSGGTGTVTVRQLPDDATDDDRQAAIDAAREAQAEKERKERRKVLDNNKAWRSAETVRRKWLTEQLATSAPPKGTAKFVADELHRMSSWSNGLAHAVSNNNTPRIVASLLGVDGGADAALSHKIETGTDNRALVIALAHVVGMHESELSVESWRSPAKRTARYFEHLAELGYPLSDVEKLAAGQKPARRRSGKATAESEAS